MNIEKINAAGLKVINVAKERGIAVSLTVVDSGCHIIYQYRMDDANFMTNDVSFVKAKTAFLFKCPSDALRAVVEKVPVLLPTIQQIPGDACMLEGGLPLKLNDKIIGGVGVSGGNFEQDLFIATTFIEVLNEESIIQG